jgi:hypothetical protein
MASSAKEDVCRYEDILYEGPEHPYIVASERVLEPTPHRFGGAAVFLTLRQHFLSSGL